MTIEQQVEQARPQFEIWRNDWNMFARDVLNITLDPEQQEILHSVQTNRKTAVSSGTARGKDYTAAAAGICFMYLTPWWDKETGKMTGNTKVAMTAPTDRQVKIIMIPEITRIWNHAKYRLPGRLMANGIQTHLKEWFLIGFKADSNKTEAWTGFHAMNTLFIVTEASGMAEGVYTAIEGNLQGNSRLLIVFNPNVSTGYAARAMKSKQFAKLRLDSLTAPNVIAKQHIYPGQVDYDWVKSRVDEWCEHITREEFAPETEGDFEFDGLLYRPNDSFRVKVRGMFPKVSADVLVQQSWIDAANERWEAAQKDNIIDDQRNIGSTAEVAKMRRSLRLGADIAGQGRDANALVYRHGDYVDKIEKFYGNDATIHMQMAGRIKTIMEQNTIPVKGRYPSAFIDTIGEGAGVYSRLWEMAEDPESIIRQPGLHSVKFSEGAKDGTTPLTDITGERQFVNMRAYLFWAIRDWLDPQFKSTAMLPPNDELAEELTEIKWMLKSNGKIQVEDKDELKKRIHRSPDQADTLANTFYPVADLPSQHKKEFDVGGYFH